MKFKKVLVLLAGLVLSAQTHAGLFDAVKNVGGGLLEGVASAAGLTEPFIITNLQYVGVSDDAWADQNNYSKEEFSRFKSERDSWLGFMELYSGQYKKPDEFEYYEDSRIYKAEGCDINIYRPWDNHYGQLEYTVRLPEVIRAKIAYVPYGHGAQMTTRTYNVLCEDGFLSIPPGLSSTSVVYFVYYTALGDHPLTSESSFGLVPSDWDEKEYGRGPKTCSEVDREKRLWTPTAIAATKAATEKKSAAEREKMKVLAPLLEKFDLGPFTLGSTIEDVMARNLGALSGTESAGYTLKPDSGEVLFVGKEVKEVVLETEEGVIVSIKLLLGNRLLGTDFDIDMLHNTLVEKYGEGVGLSDLFGYQSTRWGKKGQHTLCLGLEPVGMMGETTWYIELADSISFEDKIKPLREAREKAEREKEQTEKAAMFDEL